MEYFFIFCFSALLLCTLIGDVAAKKYILPIFIAILLLYFGFRDGYGTDYPNYIAMAEILKYQPDLSYVGGEIGFRTLILLFNSLGLPSYTILFASFSISILCISFASYRFSPSVTLSFVVIFGFGFLFASFNIVRQALAFSIICSLLVLIEKEKYFKFIICSIVVGVLIHKTAILLAVLPFLRFLKLQAKTWSVFLFSSIVLMQVSQWLFSLMQGFLSKDWFAYAHYFDSEWAIVSRNNTYLNLIIGLIIGIWIISRVDWFNSSVFNRIIFNAYLIGFCVHVIFINIQAFNRMALIFTWFSFLVVPMAIMSYKRESNRLIASAGLIAYTIVISWVSVSSHMQNFDIGNHLFP